MATSTTFPTTEFSKCFECRSIFPSLQQLIGHCRQQHTGMPFVCDLCGRAIKYLRNFKQHQMVHSGEKPHECQDCGKAFARRNKLRRHERIHAENPFYCRA
ncbi:hypothetical protein CDAR_47981 [Caerostris darwini]|uniref:C2H2-type domain-containing protein n=1 Tax=Caerostris darwini TaxID=1538125 RepID=A0AAV4SR14_9ARAC|nr:hypothetical protein CDAR_47981 [Caerostris darwini]